MYDGVVYEMNSRTCAVPFPVAGKPLRQPEPPCGSPSRPAAAGSVQAYAAPQQRAYTQPPSGAARARALTENGCSHMARAVGSHGCGTRYCLLHAWPPKTATSMKHWRLLLLRYEAQEVTQRNRAQVCARCGAQRAKGAWLECVSTWFSFLLPSEKSSSTIASKSFDIMSNVSFCCSAVVYLRVAA